jgi:imidazolonepropionase-like amidohydrolase
MAILRTLLIASCALAAWAQTVVLKNFTLIDGTGKPAAAGSAMIVSDGKIQWVGPASKLKAPAGADTVDLTGKFVMPGIINLHGHVGNTKGLVQDPKNFTRENVADHLKTYVSYGVTAVVSMGSEQDLIMAMRSEQGARPKTTRIFTARRGFTGVNGYPTSAQGMKGVPFEVSTVAEVDKAVNWLADQKVDIVKIWVDDHLGKEKKIPLELCKAIIEKSHAKGLKVGAHIFYLDDAKYLVNAGLNGLAHSVRDKPVDKELIEMMKKKGAWLQAATLAREASTFFAAKAQPFYDDPFFQRSVTPDVLKTLRDPAFQKRAAGEPDTGHGPEWLAMAQKNLKTLYDSGVKVGFGTDSGPPRRFLGYNEHWEMEMMAEAGLKPEQIITIATKNSAEFLGRKDLGTLETGKSADLIVLGRNPLENIKNTRTIETVWVAGNKVN